jgi:ATP-dependent protease HslVU (ClpYQ) peptidase subunit
MRREPLFIRFANGDIKIPEVINSFISSTSNEKSKEIAQKSIGIAADICVFSNHNITTEEIRS